MFWLKCRKVFLNLEQQRSLPLNETPFMFYHGYLTEKREFSENKRRNRCPRKKRALAGCNRSARPPPA
ncbi:hypothetical protein D9V87_04635 [Bacteroidetes/Chlorobi group bacterium MS-B_bin-24]|nr:MAG: hypothetical protein D9V87_04635 [Bacteroidetes/Chlorobi group bacterium MS-B_bin-24]